MIEARRVAGDHPDALAMIQAMVEGLRTIYGPVKDPALARPEQMSPPGGGYVLLYEAGRPVAGGGFRRLEAGVAEIKRMYVVPPARSRGLARRLLAELEAAVRDLGYERVRLDTGREQPHAEALYRSAGYREIHDYNANHLAAFWGEKAL